MNTRPKKKILQLNLYSALCAQTRRISRCKHCPPPPLHSFAKKEKMQDKIDNFQLAIKAKLHPHPPKQKNIYLQTQGLPRAPRLPFCPFNLFFCFPSPLNPLSSLMSEHYYYYFPQLHIFVHIYIIMQQ